MAGRCAGQQRESCTVGAERHPSLKRSIQGLVLGLRRATTESGFKEDYGWLHEDSKASLRALGCDLAFTAKGAQKSGTIKEAKEPLLAAM